MGGLKSDASNAQACRGYLGSISTLHQEEKHLLDVDLMREAA
jgi:hypothetical protein